MINHSFYRTGLLVFGACLGAECGAAVELGPSGFWEELHELTYRVLHQVVEATRRPVRRPHSLVLLQVEPTRLPTTHNDVTETMTSQKQ